MACLSKHFLRSNVGFGNSATRSTAVGAVLSAVRKAGVCTVAEPTNRTYRTQRLLEFTPPAPCAWLSGCAEPQLAKRCLRSASTSATILAGTRKDSQPSSSSRQGIEAFGNDATMTLMPVGIPGWSVVVEATNKNFSHGQHLIYDTLYSSGAAREIHHFVSDNKKEVILVLTPGAGVCGHKGVAHGGFVATLFDNAFATLGFMNFKFPVTKDLAVRFLHPVKPSTPLLIRATIDYSGDEADKKGRKMAKFQGALFYQSDLKGIADSAMKGMKDATTGVTSEASASTTASSPLSTAERDPQTLAVAQALMVDIEGQVPDSWR